MVDYFVEYAANTTGANSTKITEKVITIPSVSVEVKKELIKNSYMKDGEHLPKSGYHYSAYAKIFSRRLRELLFKMQPELAQWVLDSGLLDPVLVETWKGGKAQRGDFVNPAALDEKQTQELETSLKTQKKNIQRNINIKARKEKEKLQEEIQKYFRRNNLSKQSFYDSIEKEIVTEEKGRSRQRGIYKFYCMLTYSLTIEENKSRGLDDILADLRALPNVTIVTVAVKNEKVAEGRYLAGLSIKFIPSTPGQLSAPEVVKARIIRDMKRLANVQSIYKVSVGLERLE